MRQNKIVLLIALIILTSKSMILAIDSKEYVQQKSFSEYHSKNANGFHGPVFVVTAEIKKASEEMADRYYPIGAESEKASNKGSENPKTFSRTNTQSSGKSFQEFSQNK